jgi:hypothetical protein
MEHKACVSKNLCDKSITMRYILLGLLVFPIFCFSQKTGDNKIIITVHDSVDIYEKVRTALIKNDFILKEDLRKDTIITYPREFKTMAGYSIGIAKVSLNTVTLSGFYGLKNVSYFNVTKGPRNYKPIIFYKGSHGWKLLMQVAKELDGQISYSK